MRDYSLLFIGEQLLTDFGRSQTDFCRVSSASLGVFFSDLPGPTLSRPLPIHRKGQINRRSPRFSSIVILPISYPWALCLLDSA